MVRLCLKRGSPIGRNLSYIFGLRREGAMSVPYVGFPWLEQLSLVVACIAFLFLGRIFARWPRVELWLAAAAFTCLAPSIFLVVWIGTGGIRYDTPDRIY